MEPVHGTAIPVGQGRVRRAAPGARRGRERRRRGRDHRRRAWSRRGASPATRSIPDHGRLAGANGLIALGTLVLSSGGLVQGAVGHDEAFALSLAVGITIIYCGFVLATRDGTSSRLSVAKSHGE